MTESNYASDFDQLEAELGELARSITEEDRALDTPPIDLLPAILAEIRATEVKTNDSRIASSRTETRTDISVAEKPNSRGRWLAAAAALVVIAGGGLAVARGGLNRPATGTEVASTTLTNNDLPVLFDEGGEAVLVDIDGDLVLEVDVPPLPVNELAFYEVWLIDTEVDGMISLGVLSEDGQIDVPDSVVAADFPVVDISMEPLDGDPTHSGQSILRGILDA